MVVEGPLAPWAASIAGRLESLGYRPTTMAHQLRLVGKLSGFLQQRGLAASELTGDVVEEFVGVLRAGHGSSKPTAKSLVWLVEFFVEIGVTTETSPSLAVGQEELVDRHWAIWWTSEGLLARR
jgi:hypothetical protein